MASACVNNIGISSESFLDCTAVKCPSYGWMSPRISFSCEVEKEETSRKASAVESGNVGADKTHVDSDPETSGKDLIDFEFRLEDPVKMLPADELFSEGKLVPLHFSAVRKSVPPTSEAFADDSSRSSRRNEFSSSMDPYLFSPKAPSCSGHWKELLGLKKLYQNSNVKQDQDQCKYTSSKLSSSSSSSDIHSNRKYSRSVRQLLLRTSKSAGIVDSSLSLPLIKESDSNSNESLSISSRLSLSSSSPNPDYDDLPRHSLDSDHKHTSLPRTARQITKNPPKLRSVKHKAPETPTSSARRKSPETTPTPLRDVSADSPRMISSGKILFHSLERSSSSPSSFNGGPRYKHRGMERSNSAHVVRVSPVLNVPVCTIRGASSKSGHVFGFPLFSSTQNRNQAASHRTGKNRTDRT